MAEASKNPTKRACDACKIRKVRCSGGSPCTGCSSINTQCTFHTAQGAKRGPRKLRPKTLQQIVNSQRLEEHVPRRSPSAPIEASNEALPPLETPLPPLIASPPVVSSSAFKTPSVHTPIATLILHLCVYRLRMFPIWPVVAVEDLMAALQKEGQNQNTEAYALANIISAATVGQLRLEPLKNSAEVVTKESMEAEVQRVRALGQRKLTLNQLRIVLFLHFYHEDLKPGGVQSLLYIREAITIAQIMGIHKESSYASLPLDEQQFRKRILWLLFIAERTVAILHKLPVVLRPEISFPAMEYDQEVSILPAFRTLVNLYWVFDKSDALNMLQNSDFSDESRMLSADKEALSLLKKKLHEIPLDHLSNPSQIVDFSLTRSWMYMHIWKMMTNSGRSVSAADPSVSIGYPMQVAKDLLDLLSSLPLDSIEVQGATLELKLYEIACCLVDSINQSVTDEPPAAWEAFDSRDVLNQLQSIIISHRGGNPLLVDQLRSRLTATPALPRANGSSQLSNRIENQPYPESVGNEYPASQTSSFIADGHNHQGHDQEIIFAAHMSDSPNVTSQNFIRERQQQQPHFISSFPWEPMAGEVEANFRRNYENANASRGPALQRFANESVDTDTGVMSGV